MHPLSAPLHFFPATSWMRHPLLGERNVLGTSLPSRKDTEPCSQLTTILPEQMRNRLKTTVMGLGLVRLLQDVGLTEEARATLYSLENPSRGDVEAPCKPIRKSCKAKRSKGASRHFSLMVLSGNCELVR